ncbi:MAG: tRNA (5-methylaminomethyl-2-thiouridine)(34)-methyltransferase MnmD [Candidatus Woesearchaeota archaeon]
MTKTDFSNIFLTKDSPILYNEEYQEYYHSKSGAIEESIEKYIKPCKIKELAKKGFKLLDIGFGLGYNVFTAIESALNENPNCEIEIISLEKDKEIIKKINNLKPNLKYYWIINKLEYDPKTNSYYYEDKNIFLKIKIGNAIETIKTINEKTIKFDAVFLDPFSPKKNPELWTESFFKELARLIKKESFLATYSYAKSVRENLKKAGFEVFDGPILGRRSPSTIAKLKY